ncbi:Hypp3038 [Branchiostoma lanceolatum]|uniref:Hypp3038 protein n=1 Tax=Branchiostoma lanceolatum TaxID=7740 RepID=A0A8J9ZYU1_BRALA|nr:Hypp3038 [Branchiostoma lanceolatum]
MPTVEQKLLQIQEEAQITLKEAMRNERSKRWKRVVENYNHLLKLVSRRNLPEGYEPPASKHIMLLYELYYHLGLALQNLGRHREAIKQYTKAIKVVSIPKNGCLAGCHSNSCLMTPLFAKRAFAYAKCWDKKNALRDAEKAVVLDNVNPDVYCIRALAWMTFNEEKMAIQDLSTALKRNPRHACALILRGTIDRPMALEMNPHTNLYLDVKDFDSPKIIDFYNRFLFSLNVPHTVSSISLISEARSRRLAQSNRPQSPQGSPGMAWSTGSVPAATQLSSPGSPSMDARGPARPPFRCGTPSRLQRTADSAVRRWQYGMAIRAHSVQQAADPISSHIRALTGTGENRSQSAHPLLYGTAKPVQQSTSTQAQRRVKTATPFTKGATPMATGLAAPNGPSPESIKVFEQVNLENMPRMYYKPWKGDKLPATETERRKTAPVFKV